MCTYVCKCIIHVSYSLEAEAIQALEDTGQDIGPSPKINESQNTILVSCNVIYITM